MHVVCQTNKGKGRKEGWMYGLLISLASISCLPFLVRADFLWIFYKPSNYSQRAQKHHHQLHSLKNKNPTNQVLAFRSSKAKPKDTSTAASLILMLPLLLVLNGRGVTSQTIQNVISFKQNSNLNLVLRMGFMLTTAFKSSILEAG